MINIRPVSDLRNKFAEIEEEVITTNSPIFLTKNGYGAMVVMSIEQYSFLTDSVEKSLDEADKYADECKVRHSKEEVFKRVRERINGKSKILSREQEETMTLPEQVINDAIHN